MTEHVDRENAVTSEARRIRLFVAYRIISRLYFHLSILYIFLLQAPHGTLVVAVILAAYGVAVSLGTPLGRVVLRSVGPAGALIIGELLKAVGLVLLVLAPASIALALVGQVINAVGFAITTVADPAAVSRVSGGDARVAGRLQSSTQSVMFLALLASGVAGGFLYNVDPRLPLVGGAVAAVLAAVTAIGLRRMITRPAPGSVATGKSTGDVVPGFFQEERPWVSYYVLTRGFMLGAFVGLLPYHLFVVVGIGVIGLAFCLAGYSLAAFITARYVRPILDTLGPGRYAVLSGVILIVALAVFATTDSVWAASTGMVLLGAASGGVRPATMSKLTEVAAEKRGGAIPPELIGRMERLFGICNAAVILLGGIAITLLSFPAAMALAIATYLAIQVVLQLLGRAGASRAAEAAQ